MVIVQVSEAQFFVLVELYLRDDLEIVGCLVVTLGERVYGCCLGH